MFFLRCAFWLSIVYSSMSWTSGTLQARVVGAQAAATARTETGRLADKAFAGANDFCARHAAECLADAIRLTSLFTATTDPTNAPGPKAGGATDDHAVTPRPAPVPRHHGRDAKLARAS